MIKRSSTENQIPLLSLLSNIILFCVLVFTLFLNDISNWLIALISVLSALLIAWTTTQIKSRLLYQAKSQANLLEALVHGDYALRARSNDAGNVVSPLAQTINKLAERLSKQRWQSIENQILVQTILEHVDIGILALNDQNQVQLCNPAAEQLFGSSISQTGAALPSSLKVAASLSSEQNTVIELKKNEQLTKFNLHIAQYKDAGRPHKLLFISNIHHILRSEQQQAWQRLIRVISHEINNSLSPITSLSQTLIKISAKQPTLLQQSQIISSLQLIEQRASGLAQFIESYKQLAKLPKPNRTTCSVTNLLRQCSSLFPDITVHFNPTHDVNHYIDAIQFEQVFINIFKNAQEAAHQVTEETVVQINVHREDSLLRIEFIDNGTGINNKENLFVPFYTTKKQGSGIGLVLSQQIIEAHHGRLSLDNRANNAGCIVTIELPHTSEQLDDS